MTRPVVAHDDCQGPLEYRGYAVGRSGFGKLDTFPLIAYGVCAACGYAEVVVDYPDGTERRVKVRDGEGMQRKEQS